MKKIILCLLVLCLSGLSACSPIGAVAGAGAALGVAAAREDGISGTAGDIKIKALISDKWFKYDIETFTKLNLTVNQGRVLITGVVQDPDDRVEAVRLAWQVEGVNQVLNEIRVADSDGFPGYVRDQWITTRLRTAITFDREIYSINYSIDTVAGTIYLMGVARSQAELNKVVEVARTIPNVVQVVNYVRLTDQQTPQEARQVTAPQDGGRNVYENNSGAENNYTAPAAAVAPAEVESEELVWPDQ